MNTGVLAAGVEKPRWPLWVSVGTLSGLSLILYGQVLVRLVDQWWSDPDYGHGFIVPLFAGYVIWQERDRLARITLRPAGIGLAVVFGALGLLLVGTLGAELFISRFSFLVLLTGMVLFLGGWQLLQALSFPLGYLILMIPLPAIIYNQITFPLQLIASRFASTCLRGGGVPVLREGNLIILPNYTLEVVEACSGIRSLLSLIALAIAYGYFVEKRWWVRILLVVLMFPIAVVSNGLRVMGTGFLTYGWGPESAEGFFHAFSGWLIFVTAMLMLFSAHWLIGRVLRSREAVAHE